MNAITAEPAAVRSGEPAVAIARPRIQSVDVLRGLVMIIMALDHVRDFLHYGAQHFDPTDLAQTTPFLFFTRWMTHFCAPTFMFLAGTGAYLQARRGKSVAVVTQFLWTRGLWLIVLELTFVRWFGWQMNFGNNQVFLWVIWALGVSMICLAGLIHLPWRILLTISLIVIGLHNTLDAVTPAQFGALGWLWSELHVPDVITASPQVAVFTSYPLIPWVFVMAAGFCFGRVLDLESEQRRKMLIRLGSALIAGFIVLRWSNLYGDASPWAPQSSTLMTLASFLRCTKYPPSLLYLLMTLGPSILILGLLERVRLAESNPLIVFGRVPLFYYLLHLPLIHGVAILLCWLRYGSIGFILYSPPSLLGPEAAFPPDYGYSLASVYLIWIGVVVALYLPCRWFAALKQRNKSVALSYF